MQRDVVGRRDELLAVRDLVAGKDVMLVGDRATGGRRKVVLGTDPFEDLWIAISAGGRRSAIEVATAVTRQLLGG